MIATIRSFAVAWAMLLAFCVLPAQTLQLASGQVLLAKVEEATGEGLRVRRLDNGGVLDLRWDQLSPVCATAIKRANDLMGDSQDEILVRADELEFLVNGSRQTRIGKIQGVEDGAIVLQVKGSQFRIPRGELRTTRTVEVPAMQVYTKDEFYAMRLQELRPGDSADKHILVAEEMIKVRDYEHADLHLQKARELGNSNNAGHLEQLGQRLQRYKEAAKERELLDQIQAARSRGQLPDFEKGTKLIADFAKQFPQSKLKQDFELEKKKFGEARTRYLTQQVAEQFRRSIQVLAEKKAADAGTALAAAREYAESKMTDDIHARVAQQLRLEVDEVKQLWGQRDRTPVGKRTEHFSYGIGSWVLGEEAILKGTRQGDANAKQNAQASPPVAGNTRQVEALARALREALERRRAQVQGQGGQAAEQQPDDWWNEASRPERTSWLRAYYAEFGGQLVMTFQTVSPCISCYGDGTTPEIDPEGKLVRNKCFLCQGTKWLRSFKAY
ncbi:MAG: hypothetical protein JNL08_14020 [Planctomycetes bacterium]|nr:hypothetical protein [Planctomycetota bacterium]